MLANSIRRALPTSCTRSIGQAARAGNKVGALPAAATSARTPTTPVRRRASTGTSAAQTGRPTPEDRHDEPAPKWTGGGVLGVAIGAGLLGWGIASVTTRRNGKSAWLLDSNKPFSRYASLKEMEIVSANRVLDPKPKCSRYYIGGGLPPQRPSSPQLELTKTLRLLSCMTTDCPTRLFKKSARSSAPSSTTSSPLIRRTCTRTATRSGRRRTRTASPWRWRTRDRQNR